MRSLFLNACCPGDSIEDFFIVTGKQLSVDKNGSHYIKLFVGDRTAQFNGRIWKATREMFGELPESGVVRLRARIENYQNNLQLVVEQIWPAKEGDYSLDDLMPHTSKDVPEMCRRINELLDSIQNRHLAAIVQVYQDDRELMDNFCKSPAAMSFHHAYIGGLLEHTLNGMEVADAVVRFYPGLNRDLCLVGIFLHDIAKTWELTYATSFGYSDGGQLIGHIVKSVLWIEKNVAKAELLLGDEKIPRPLVDVLEHIVLSHHDKAEFGSPKAPATPEAIFVHHIENLDAKMMMSLEMTRGEHVADASGNWTEYMKAFGGRLYRPDVAPVDAPINEDPGDAPPTAPAIPVDKPKPGQAPEQPLVINNPLFERVAPGRK